jgi:hypothetical protein
MFRAELGTMSANRIEYEELFCIDVETGMKDLLMMEMMRAKFGMEVQRGQAGNCGAWSKEASPHSATVTATYEPEPRQFLTTIPPGRGSFADWLEGVVTMPFVGRPGLPTPCIVNRPLATRLTTMADLLDGERR